MADATLRLFRELFGTESELIEELRSFKSPGKSATRGLVRML